MTQAQELVERYLLAVGTGLPAGLRADVTRELGSLIQDKLQERSLDSGQPVASGDALSVLRELGPPHQVARRYQPERFLVGPAFYPLFAKVTRIVLAGALGLVVLLAIVGELLAPSDAPGLFSPGTLLRYAGLYYQMAIGFFAYTVIVFACLERFLKAPPLSSDWDPEDLPELPDPHETHFGMAQAVPHFWWLVLIAIVLNACRPWHGVVNPGPEGLIFIPFTEFGIRIPYVSINVWLVFEAALAVMAFRYRRWTLPLRWTDIGLTVALAVILLQIPADSVLQAPAALPQITPALGPARLALYALPAGLFIGALVSAIELVTERRPEKTES
jgi:hypothetical protein